MRYFIAFLVTLGLIIFLIFLLFRGGGTPRNAVTPRTLTSYASTNSDVSMTIDGPVVADQNYAQVNIVVNASQVTFQQIQGYQGTVVNQQTFANNANAYNVFLHALLHAGFSQGRNSKALSDERGICATGQVYIFELHNDGNQLQRYWATSCGGTKTYLGSLSLTITLFQAQVPGYTDLTQNVQL